MVRLVNHVLDLLPDRMSWQVYLAWDSHRNIDVGWLCTAGPIPSNSSLDHFQLRNWNLGPVPDIPTVARTVHNIPTVVTTIPSVPNLVSTVPSISTTANK